MRQSTNSGLRLIPASIAGASVLLCILGLSGACAVVSGIQANAQDHHYTVSVVVEDEHSAPISDAEMAVFVRAPDKGWFMVGPADLAPVEKVERSGDAFHIDTHGRWLMLVFGKSGFWDQALMVYADGDAVREHAPRASSGEGYLGYGVPATKSSMAVARTQPQPFHVALRRHAPSPLQDWESVGYGTPGRTIEIQMPVTDTSSGWRPSLRVNYSKAETHYTLAGLPVIAAPSSVHSLQEMSFAPVIAPQPFEKPLRLQPAGTPTFFYICIVGYYARASITVAPDGSSAALQLQWQPDRSRCLP